MRHREILKSFHRLLVEGGSGSGNFGHMGRPGKKGGSGKGGRSFLPSKTEPGSSGSISPSSEVPAASVSFKTPDEMKEAFRKNLGFRAVMSKDATLPKFKKIAEKAAVVFDDFKRLKEQFPKIASLMEWGNEGMNGLQSMTFHPGTSFSHPVPGRNRGATYGGLYSGESSSIRVATGKRTDPELSIGKGAFLTGRDISSVARHEFGHHVYAKKCGYEWDGLHSKLGGDAFFMKKVSDYARTNSKEAFAESFSAYTSLKYTRGKLPTEVEAFLDKYVGGGIV